MRSLISEFSYGFALTHEFVLMLGQLLVAPVFPSLIEEGRSGGGYDVKMNAPGIPLFFQFKRSECLQRRRAREIAAGAALKLPYWRFAITGSADSDQHEMLIDLDHWPNLVFYAAPMFHLKAEFDEAFLRGAVRQRSFYVRPRDIGSFDDEAAHHVSFDGNLFVKMSKPRQIKGFGTIELEAMLNKRLDRSDRPFHATIKKALRQAEAAKLRSRERLARRSSVLQTPRADDRLLLAADDFFRRQEESILPQPREFEDDPNRAALQRLADLGLREFDTQLYVVQKKYN